MTERCEEPPIEVSAREGRQDPVTHALDEWQARAADVEPGRAVQEDGLDPILERDRRLHVEDDRDRDSVRFVRRWVWNGQTNVRGAWMPLPDPTGGDGNQRFGSSHSGGFNMLFADGSVQFMYYRMNGTHWVRLGLKGDGNFAAHGY